MSPFRSKKQMRFFAVQEKKGKLPKGTTERWLKHTKRFKSLPEKAKRKKR
jgi:hypothetical protein